MPMPPESPSRHLSTKTGQLQTVLGNCLDGTRVELYTIFGGRHTWPSGPQYLPAWVVRRVRRDLHASQLILEFFAGTMGARSPADGPQ